MEQREPVSVIIPLADRMNNPEWELRILLRSLYKNARNLGQIHIAFSAAKPPAWIKPDSGIFLYRVLDKDPNIKDHNLAEKTLFLLQKANTSFVCFSADDAAVLKPISLYDLPVLYTSRTFAALSASNALSKWQRRLKHTLHLFSSVTKHDFESHTPLLLPRQLAINSLQRLMPWFAKTPGLTLYTPLLCTIPSARENIGGHVAQYKETCRTAEAGKSASLSKLFVGYNDAGFSTLRQRLLRLFPDPAPWER